jgi:glycosyltransferase involved in cell wall biosynthesis
MRIAQIAPLIESVPPTLYGGTERVVSTLTEELVKRGHDVTLFASGDSETAACLVPVVPRSLRLDGKARDHVAHTIVAVTRVFERANEFDLIHNHLDYLAFPFVRLSEVPVVTTTHGRLDEPEEVRNLYRFFRDVPLVSISDRQRDPLPYNNWLSTVYHGIDFSRLQLHPRPGTYLAFLGRASPEKRVDRAIEVARDLDMPLKIAAKVDEVDAEYFEHAIRPHLDHPLIEFVGEVREDQKCEFLGNAYAYLFPIDWPEPFGLTMVEAMACGTPVVAMNRGSVPEVVSEGVTGYVCDTFADFIDKVVKAGALDRARCRAEAQRRFSITTMASAYEDVYRWLTLSALLEASA